MRYREHIMALNSNKLLYIVMLTILLVTLLFFKLGLVAHAETIFYTNVSINGDSTYTNSRNVKVKLWYDGNNGLNKQWWARVGNTLSEVNNAAWFEIPLQNTYEMNWTLPSGDGQKTVYVQFKRLSIWGTTYIVNEPNKYASTIILDTTAPSAGNIEIKNADQNGYDVYVYNVADSYSGVQTVKFPTWTSYNGQDDLKWYVGTNAGNGTWKYHVSRINHNNESGAYYTHIYTYDNLGNSAYVGEVKPVIPNQASNLTISSITNSTITATWNSNGNASGAIYNLVLQRPSDGAWLSNPETTGTTYTFSGLTANTQYYVWVRVRSSTGIWATSGYQLIGQPYTLASQPTSTTWGSVDKTSLTLSWNKNGNPTNTSYRVILTNPSTGAWLYNSDFQLNISSWTFSSVTPGTQYRGLVQARNSSGTETSWTDFGTKWTLPASPSNISGTCGGLEWSETEGRGYVTLSWPAVTGATGYKVHVFDGYAYRPFDVGNVTSWDSRITKIYPSESTLNSYGDNTVTADLFNHSKTGLDLRDSPNKLYKKTSGTTYDTDTKYWFRVTAYNSSGDSGIDWSQGYFPKLPNRTDVINKPILSGPIYTGFNTVLSATGNDIAEAAYRIFYTNQIVPPSVTDREDTPGPGWIDSGVCGNMDIINKTNISKTLEGSIFGNNDWTYVVIKVGAGSSLGAWGIRYSDAYSLNNPTDVIGYVGHNQILRIFESTDELVVSDSNKVVSQYGPYNQKDIDNIKNNNIFENGAPVKYRLEFDILKPLEITKLEIFFDYNRYNLEGIEFIPNEMKLQKLNNDGSITILHTYTSEIQKEYGRNKYFITVNQPLINQQGRYFVQYKGILNIETDYFGTKEEITNYANINFYDDKSKYSKTVNPKAANRSVEINTKVTRAPIYYQ